VESALTEPDPNQVEGHVWKATAITGAAVGDVALARRYAVGGPSPLLAWPATSDVPRQVTDVHDLLTLLRMKIDLEATAPRPLIIRCLAEMDRGLADIDDVLSDPPDSPPALPAS
jgi:hypothetical protein